MKKILSVLMAVMMLISTMAVGSFNAFAATKANAPTVKIGSTLDLNIAPLKMEDMTGFMDFSDIEAAEKAMDNLDVWYAKITPSETGYYEFVFGSEFKCKGISFEELMKAAGIDDEELIGEAEGSFATCAATLTDNKNNDYDAAGIAFNFDFGEVADELGEGTGELISGLLESVSMGKTPSFTANLKAGKTYYLTIMNISSESYKTKLRIAKHKHTLKSVNTKATAKYDKDLEMNWYEEGFKGKECNCGYCEYKKGKTFSAVSWIDIGNGKNIVYTGKKLTPKVTIYLDNGKKLNKKFYTVKYSNNKNYGSGKATIKFKGNYKGKVTERFDIVPKPVGITKVKVKKKTATLKWKKSKEKISGYQIECATDKYFYKNAKLINVKGVKNTKKTIKKLKKLGKKYYFHIRTYKVVNGDKYFSAWSKTKRFKKK